MNWTEPDDQKHHDIVAVGKPITAKPNSAVVTCQLKEVRPVFAKPSESPDTVCAPRWAIRTVSAVCLAKLECSSDP